MRRGLLWTLLPTALVVYALVLLGLVPNTILPSSLMPHGQAVAEAAAAHARLASRAAAGRPLAGDPASPSSGSGTGASASAPLLGPVTPGPTSGAPGPASGASGAGMLTMTSWLGALDPWGAGAAAVGDGGTWAGVLDEPSQCLAAGGGQETAVKMAVAGLQLGALQVEKARSMNLDTIREIKATVDSITSMLGSVCIFLLKCRTILNGEYPDVSPPALAHPVPKPKTRLALAS